MSFGRVGGVQPDRALPVPDPQSVGFVLGFVMAPADLEHEVGVVVGPGGGDPHGRPAGLKGLAEPQ